MALANSSRAAAVSIDTRYKNYNLGAVYFLQQRIAVLAQGADATSYSLEKFEATTHQQVGDKLGFGSPAHLSARELLPDNGDGALGATVTIYPLENMQSALAADGAITPVGKQLKNAQYVVMAGGIKSNPFTAFKDEEPAAIIPKIVTAINGVLNMPIIAYDDTTSVKISAKTKGELGNDLKIKLFGIEQGIVFTVTKMAGGLVNPSVITALDQVGGTWETIIVNTLGESAHDHLQIFGEGRWGQLVHKPLFALSGTSEEDPNVLIAYADTRKDDRINGVIPCPGSLSANYLIAARAVARIAKQANQNPAAEYRGMRLDTIENGKDGEQWNYLQRDSAYKSGVSSTQLQDSTITLDNTLLFYHPDNNVNPEFIKVIYLIKLQNIIYNINLIFNTDEWKQAALIPDHEVSSNIAARKPSDAVAALFTLTDNLANNALIADRKFTKDNITAKIDPSNPNRVNTSFPVKLTGNWDIHSIDLLFGFYLGAS
jgi:phage tail sheath gpL-like